MRNILFSVLAIAVCGSLYAQDAVTLSFEDALVMTMTDNPSMQAAEYDELAAKRERQAMAGMHFPTLSVGGTYAYLGSDINLDVDFNNVKNRLLDRAGSFVESWAPVAPDLAQAASGLLAPLAGRNWTYSYLLQKRSLGFAGGSVTLPIFLGGKIDVANRMAKINERAVKEQTAQTRNMLISELVERYFGYALALQVVEVRKQVLDGVRKHLDDAVALERNGMIASSERLYMEFKVAEAERDLMNAEMQVETIKSALSNTLGTIGNRMPVSAIFVVEQVEGLDYFLQTAADCNPLLGEVENKRQLAHQNVLLVSSDYYPQIVAVGGGTFLNYQMTKMMPRWAVGIGVNFKIFDGLHREFKHSAARHTARRADVLKDKAGKDISVLVESLYAQMLNCRNQVSAIESSMAFASEYLKAKDAGFRAGMGASTDVVDAEMNLAKVRIERMQAAYNYDVSLAKLLEAAGISEKFADYMHCADARRICFDE